MQEQIVYGVLVIPFRQSQDQKQFLIVKHKKGFWTFPGGKQETTDQTIRNAAQREIEEEIGWEINPESLVDTNIVNEFVYGNEKPDRAGKRGITKYFLLNMEGSNTDPNPQHEIIEAEWVSENEVLTRVRFDDILQRFNEAIRLI